MLLRNEEENFEKKRIRKNNNLVKFIIYHRYHLQHIVEGYIL